jgi:hypothetical protein
MPIEVMYRVFTIVFGVYVAGAIVFRGCSGPGNGIGAVGTTPRALMAPRAVQIIMTETGPTRAATAVAVMVEATRWHSSWRARHPPLHRPAVGHELGLDIMSG